MAEAELTQDASAWADLARAWDAMGDPYRAAHAHLRASEEMLSAPGERDEAAEHLRTALATAQRIGAAGLVARAEDLGRRARLKVDAAPREPLPAHLPGGRGPRARRRRPHRP